MNKIGMSNVLKKLPLLLLLSFSLASTGRAEACTKVGCQSGLQLVVSGVSSDTYLVRIRAVNRTVECQINRKEIQPGIQHFVPETMNQGCFPNPKGKDTLGIFLKDFTETNFSIELLDGSGKKLHREVKQLKYKTLNPNGPKCPPVCSVADAMFSFSEFVSH